MVVVRLHSSYGDTYFLNFTIQDHAVVSPRTIRSFLLVGLDYINDSFNRITNMEVETRTEGLGETSR